MVEIGAVLAGKYRIDRILGQGGMGIVVQAMHLQLGQPVAMKFLLPEVLANPQVVPRFLREAQAAVRLRSEHVARVIDVGTLDTGAPYMVLEYLDGTDLSHFPRQQLTVGVIVDLVLQACEALADAHALGIVHRDIKPANFFVTQRTDGSLLLKVLDFGISKAGPANDSNMTGTQTVMGTPAYMSPEQMRSSRNVDNRSDIWSLGVVLYELLQGTPPFEAETFSSMIIKVATEPLPPMTARLPAGLAEIVYRCLEKDLTRRFQNVAELAHAIAPYAGSNVQAAVTVERTSRVLGTQPPRPTGEGARPPSTITASAGAVTAPPPARRHWPIAAAFGGILVVAIVIVAIVASTGPDTGQAPTAPAPTPTATPQPAAEPPKPEPPKPEPPKPEPPKPEPPKPEPAKVEAKTEPAKTEPVKTAPKPKPRPAKTVGSGSSDDDVLGRRN
jgi:eukaryotic-like serine/threonine-protein kinase